MIRSSELTPTEEGGVICCQHPFAPGLQLRVQASPERVWPGHGSIITRIQTRTDTS
jgi:hypothetical protein